MYVSTTNRFFQFSIENFENANTKYIQINQKYNFSTPTQPFKSRFFLFHDDDHRTIIEAAA